jgi:hypothetical protein
MYKRLWSDDLTNEKTAGEVSRLQPGLILLKNGTRVVQALLGSQYRLVYYDGAHPLYAHQTISRLSFELS